MQIRRSTSRRYILFLCLNNSEGDLELQAKLIAEQYEAWEEELSKDEGVAAETLRRRIHSFSSNRTNSPNKERGSKK
jgi:hypothetical protein